MNDPSFVLRMSAAYSCGAGVGVGVGFGLFSFPVKLQSLQANSSIPIRARLERDFTFVCRPSKDSFQQLTNGKWFVKPISFTTGEYPPLRAFSPS